jgi:hypothetical protein
MIAASTVVAVLSGATLLAATADAHSFMIDPYPTWPVSWATNQFAGTIAGQTYLPVPDGMSYQTDPLLNTEAYWIAFNESTYTSLKDLADQTMEMQTLSPFGTATKECGFSLANGTARALPEYVEWNQFTSGHDGPCEVWCDDVLAFQDDNCAVNYPDDPAQLPYDITKCESASMLTSYWIALHGLPWQVYINCVPLNGEVNSTDSSTTSSTTSSTSTTTTAPTTTTVAPTTTTTAPTTTTTAPATTTATPTTTTAAPSTSTTTSTTTTSASSDDASEEDEYDDASTANEASTADEASTTEDDTTTTTSAPATTTSAPATTTAAPASTTAASTKCNARTRRN